MKPTQDTLSPFTEKSCFPQKHGPFVGTFLLCFISCFISFLIFIEMKARESTILFLLLVGWELVAGEHLLVDECPSLLPLSDFGELAKERKEVILSMYNQGTGTLPCRGLREDWREFMPRCMHSMTSLETYSFINGTDECASCRTLESVPCNTLFSQNITALFTIGGGPHMNLHCSRPGNFSLDNVPPSALLTPPACWFEERIFLDRRIQAKNIEFAVRTMIPIVSVDTKHWAFLEGSVVFGQQTLNEPHPVKENKQKTRKYPWLVMSDHLLSKIVGIQRMGLKEEEEGMREQLIRGWGKWKHLFLSISRVDHGKGQASLVNKMVKEKNYFLNRSIHVKFILSMNKKIEEVKQLQAALSSAKEAGLIPKILSIDEKKYKKEFLHVMYQSAAGLVHYGEADRNPRIIAEALISGLPIISTIQSAPFIGLECVPPSVALITDVSPPSSSSLSSFSLDSSFLKKSPLATLNSSSSPPSFVLSPKGKGELERVFERFLVATANRSKVEEKIRAVVDGFEVTRIYPEICRKLGLCAQNYTFSPRKDFMRVMREGGVEDFEGGVMGEGFEGMQCESSDFNLCLRWSTILDSENQKTYFKKLYPHYYGSGLSKTGCYTKKGLGLFMNVLGKSTKSTSLRTIHFMEYMRNKKK